MKCRNCGNEVNDQQAFCDQCGEPIQGQGAENQNKAYETQSANNEFNQDDNVKSSDFDQQGYGQNYQAYNQDPSRRPDSSNQGFSSQQDNAGTKSEEGQTDPLNRNYSNAGPYSQNSNQQGRGPYQQSGMGPSYQNTMGPSNPNTMGPQGQQGMGSYQQGGMGRNNQGQGPYYNQGQGGSPYQGNQNANQKGGGNKKKIGIGIGIAVLIIALVILAVKFLGGGSGSDPEATVKEFETAWNNLDYEEIVGSLSSYYGSDFESMFQGVDASTAMLFGEDPEEMLQTLDDMGQWPRMSIEIVEVYPQDYTEDDEVEITANMTMEFMGESQEATTYFYLIYENGKWVIDYIY